MNAMFSRQLQQGTKFALDTRKEVQAIDSRLAQVENLIMQAEAREMPFKRDFRPPKNIDGSALYTQHIPQVRQFLDSLPQKIKGCLFADGILQVWTHKSYDGDYVDAALKHLAGPWWTPVPTTLPLHRSLRRPISAAFGILRSIAARQRAPWPARCTNQRYPCYADSLLGSLEVLDHQEEYQVAISHAMSEHRSCLYVYVARNIEIGSFNVSGSDVVSELKYSMEKTPFAWPIRIRVCDPGDERLRQAPTKKDEDRSRRERDRAAARADHRIPTRNEGAAPQTTHQPIQQNINHMQG